ncbi:kinase-like domain-containing protein, partial [Phycomyces blakesleeanus]
IIKRNNSLSNISLWIKEKKSSSGETFYIWIFEEGLILQADKTVFDLYGYTPEELIGRSLKSIIPTWNQGFEKIKTFIEWKSAGGKTKNDAMFPISFKLLEMSQGSSQKNPYFICKMTSIPLIAGLVEIEKNGVIESCNQLFAKSLFGRTEDSLINKTKIEEILPQFPTFYKHLKEGGLLQSDPLLNNATCCELIMDTPSLDGADQHLIYKDNEPLPLILAKHDDGSLFEVKVKLMPVHNDKRLGLWVSFYTKGVYTRQGHTQDGFSHLESKNQNGLDLPTPPTPINSPLANYIPEKGSEVLATVPAAEEHMTVAATEEATTNTPSINDYTVLTTLGAGAFGIVRHAHHNDRPDEELVIKFVTKSNILVDSWVRDRSLGVIPVEIHVLNTLRKNPHPNCASMLDFFEDDDYCYIVMPKYGDGMDLFDSIEFRSEVQNSARHIFKQIALAVQHLHHHKIVHRDIKDENIILDRKNQVWLIDFGSAAYVKSNRLFETFVGTFDYVPPEILRGESYEGPPQDIWALGILLYTIIYKENPFYCMEEIMGHELRVAPDACPIMVDLIEKMLRREVAERINIDQVLEHAWLA